MSTSLATTKLSLPTTVRLSMERPGIKMIKLPESLVPSSINLPRRKRTLATSPSTADFTRDPDWPPKTPTGFSDLSQGQAGDYSFQEISDKASGVFSRTRILSSIEGEQTKASGADESQSNVPLARPRCRHSLTPNSAWKRVGGVDHLI